MTRADGPREGAASPQSPSRPSKARPQNLESELIPELIRKVGDPKSMRLAQWMVEAYLERHVLIFDKKFLAEMFVEADFKEEGSLCPRAIAAAVSGRYPQRKMTQPWRQLVMLLLGQQEMVLSSEAVQPRRTVNGVFNGDGSGWTSQPPALPAVAQHRITSLPAKLDFQKPLSTSWGGQSVQALTMTGTGSAPLASSLKASGQLNAFAAPRLNSNSPSDALVLTAAGFRTTASTAKEDELNKSLAASGGLSRCTFEDTQKFATFQRELAIAASERLGTAAASQLAASAATHGDLSWSLPGRMATSAMRSCSTGRPLPTARLGGTLTSTTPSALHTLRSGVQGAHRRMPAFELWNKPVMPHDLTKSQAIDTGVDKSPSLARQEPQRPTDIRFGASFLEWGDYNTKCRTLPSVWDHGHPAAPAASKVPTQFPWESNETKSDLNCS